MKPSDKDKLQRLLDYRLRLDDPDARAETEKLLAGDEEARRLNTALGRSFEALQSWTDETVPADLTQNTLEFIAQRRQQQRTMARASAAIAAQSTGSEAVKKTSGARGRWVFFNLRDLIATAATLTVVFLLIEPALKQARNVSRQHACAAQMRQVGFATTSYAQDHNNFLPYVKHRPGAKWWNVGWQGMNNTSNTRNFFLLVKHDYLPITSFLCPAGEGTKHIKIKISPEVLQHMQDFAKRTDVNYSFRLMFDNRSLRLSSANDAPLMADQNPLFAEFDSEKQDQLDLSGNSSLLQLNSPNHTGQGQNVLHSDGHVRFVPNRFLGPRLDDIFTIKTVKIRYRGNELPQSKEDIFIAP